MTMTRRQELKRLKEIKRKHDAIVETARVKRNVRLLGLKAKRLEAEENRAKPRLPKGFHIRTRDLVKLATTELDELAHKKILKGYQISSPMLIQMIQSRYGLEDKIKKILGVEELVSE
jgi:hypothetical protein